VLSARLEGLAHVRRLLVPLLDHMKLLDELRNVRLHELVEDLLALRIDNLNHVDVVAHHADLLEDRALLVLGRLGNRDAQLAPVLTAGAAAARGLERVARVVQLGTQLLILLHRDGPLHAPRLGLHLEHLLLKHPRLLLERFQLARLLQAKQQLK
jgi:hypothetical protein